MDVDEVLADLWAESSELDGLVGGLTTGEWAQATPAEGWTIAHQIGHLAWTDEAARLAAAEPDGFAELLERGATNPTGYVDDAAAEGAALPPDQLLVYWRETRADLREALKAVPAGEKIPWFGPPMSATSMATARLMETWAHGQDVADALGVRRPASNRLRHVAHLAVRTRGFAYLLHGKTAPDVEIRVELTGPGGDVWAWGPEDAAQRVSGPALDFCLLATQRRHRDDLELVAIGTDAEEWLRIAQAFAGLPGKGRQPGQFGDGAGTRADAGPGAST